MVTASDRSGVGLSMAAAQRVVANRWHGLYRTSFRWRTLTLGSTIVGKLPNVAAAQRLQ
jgi:hypothetical protein